MPRVEGETKSNLALQFVGTHIRHLPHRSASQVYCIEDSAPMRRWLEHCLTGCGTVKVFGEEAADVERFVTAVLADGDIVVCDQNLEYGGKTVLGTDLVRRLVSEVLGSLT